MTYRFTSGSIKNMEKNFSKIDKRIISMNLGLMSFVFNLLISPFNFPSSTDCTEEYVNELPFFNKAAQNPAAQTC